MRRPVFAAALLSLLVAGAATGAERAASGVVQTWRVEGVVHDLLPGADGRPPVLLLAPGFDGRTPSDQAAIVDEIARAAAPPAGPRVLMIRAPDRQLYGRWTPDRGFEPLN